MRIYTITVELEDTLQKTIHEAVDVFTVEDYVWREDSKGFLHDKIERLIKEVQVREQRERSNKNV